MKVLVELPIKKKEIDCGPPIGPLIAPYGIDINEVVSELNKLLAERKISLDSKVPIEIDLEDRSWRFVGISKKITEVLRELSNNGKIKYSDLVSFAKSLVQEENSETLSKKIKDLEGTCKSMHLEIVK